MTGVGGKQILVEDPSGNPVELFEPLVQEASLLRVDVVSAADRERAHSAGSGLRWHRPR